MLASFCFEGTEHVVSPVLQYVSHIVVNIGIEIYIVCNKLIIRNNKLISYKRHFFAVALRPNAGHGLLILYVSRSHTTTHHSQ